MHIQFSLSDLPALKTELRRYHPDASASERIEAAARGFGFKTYAAMRAGLEQNSLVLSPDPQKFYSYLELPTDDLEKMRSLSRALARIAVRRVMNNDATLTAHGFDSIYPRQPDDWKLTIEERKAAFALRRQETLGDWEMDQFELALIYLDKQQKRKTINHKFGSYGLKHKAEGLSRHKGQHTHLGNYVSNGVFIIAALTRGFMIKQHGWNNPNGSLNISSVTVNASDGDFANAA